MSDGNGTKGTPVVKDVEVNPSQVSVEAVNEIAAGLFPEEQKMLGEIKQRIMKKIMPDRSSPAPSVMAAAQLFMHHLDIASLALGGLGGAIGYSAVATEKAAELAFPDESPQQMELKFSE
jgi:hypothetical protein